MLIDTHAHINFNAYKNDGSSVIRRALDSDIYVINVGSQLSTSKRAVKIAFEYKKGIYAAIGLHPIHLFESEVDEEEVKFASRQERFDESAYQELIDNDKDKKIVAIGEIGLDYYHVPGSISKDELKSVQKEQFTEQLRFAAKNNLPVILHSRDSVKGKLDSYKDIIDILKKEIKAGMKIGGVKHCFDANVEIANEFFNLGFLIGFTGIITFGKNAEPIRDIVRQVPLEKILVETDCPYMSPDPYRGQRNEPLYVKEVAKKIAEIKKIDFPKVVDQTFKNSKELFFNQ
jgi:TatD DNase family protein